MIVDCHTHLNRYSAAQPASLAERYALLRAEMDANAVRHAVVITSYLVNDDRPSTEEVLRVVGADARVQVVAGVCVARLTAELPALRALLRAERIRGLKLYPGYEPFDVHDRALDPVYEAAAEFGVPVMIHTGDTFDPGTRVKHAHPLEVDEVAVRHRDTTLVLCHLGNPWFTDAAEVIYKNQNVMGDLSGLTLGEFEPRFERFAINKVNEVLAFVNDPAKLMFGTDWPISSMGSYLRFVRRLEATDEEMEGMLWRNAARLFRMDVDGDRAEGANGVG
ncbi:MAG TPA: amidohydrolase family protein [Longimicrobiaceae bacterium]|nr:amidohydrolase family protein [Longimicrobiaceae bacterium]